MWAKAWLAETDSQFRLLLDPDRLAYQAYGLERSAWRAWSPRTIWYYIKAKLQGKEQYDSHGEDVHQLGGDFIVDNKGILRFVYRSHDPVDRPSVAELHQVLEAL